MRVVFMGTPAFAVPTLEALAKHCEVVGVYTRPDSVSGRGTSERPSPVKALATMLQVPVSQPTSLRDDEAVAGLRALAPDMIVVAAYGLILPAAVLDVAPVGAVNVHASLLPRWRGAAPLQRAILAGDSAAGVSIMRMEEGLDTGPYCAQVATPIGEMCAGELTLKVARMGADALIAALDSITEGSAVWVAQDDALATYADKVTKADIAIGPDMPALAASRRVCASLPTSPCRAKIAGRAVTIMSAKAVDSSETPVPAEAGLATTKSGVLLGMSEGALLVTRLKPDGKSEMAAADWARGMRDLDGATWQGHL